MAALFRALVGHPLNPPCFAHRAEISVRHLPGGLLAVGYAIHGPSAELRLPTSRAPAPADALWRTTCCELFIGPASGIAYREFNFSPSGQWAVYDFEDYRRHAAATPDCPAPAIRLRGGDEYVQMDVTLAAAALPVADELRLALSVVLEAADGSLGYWALAHPPGRPDFHHRDCFALKLEAAR